MSNKRKEMWKLLYNLVKRNETELDEVFGFVDDILCKEPSLIRAYSLRETNNRFQDTFIVWLLSKFVKCLEDVPDKDTHQHNMSLQKKLLSSCFVNRAVLFERLVAMYAQSIAELVQKIGDFTWENDDDAFVTLTTFSSNDKCLLEMDADFEFPEIRIQVENADERLCDLLDILEHMLHVGNDVFSQHFIKSLASVHLAIKHCDMPVKLRGLRFCLRLFELTHTMTPLLEEYYALTLHALVIMCELWPVWLRADCMQPDDLEELLEITCDVLKAQEQQLHQLHHPQMLLNHCFALLSHSISLAHTAPKLQQLFEQLGKFILSLLINDSSKPLVLVSEGQRLLLWQAAEAVNGIFMRPLAASLMKTDAFHWQQNLTKLRDKIMQLVGQQAVCSSSQLKLLAELLRATIYLEQKLHQATDQKDLKALEFADAALFHQNLQTFLRHAAQIEQNFDQNFELLTVAALLLQSECCLSASDTQQLIIMLNLLEKPLKTALGKADGSLNSNERELAYHACQLLCSVWLTEDSPHNDAYRHFKQMIGNLSNKLFAASAKHHGELRAVFCQHSEQLVALGVLSSKHILQSLVLNLSEERLLAQLLRPLYCSSQLPNCHFMRYSIYQQRDKHFELVCAICNKWQFNNITAQQYKLQHHAYSVQCLQSSSSQPQQKFIIPTNLKTTLGRAIFHSDDFLFLAQHQQCPTIDEHSLLKLITPNEFPLANAKLQTFKLLAAHHIATSEDFRRNFGCLLLKLIKRSLQPPINQKMQLKVLELLESCTLAASLPEAWLFHYFKMSFFYLLHTESLVTHEAIVWAAELCCKHRVQPIQLWNWYKRDALALIVKLAVHAYLSKGVRLTRSLKAFTKMLGFSCVQEFICKYYRLLTTMILPYCVKEPKCKGLIVSISKITRKPIPNIFIVSFLRIYTHIYLTEDAEVGNKCIELFVKCTGSSLSKLMNSDVKQTVAEFLIYFNRNPSFVMKAFHCLLLNDSPSSSSSALALSSITSTQQPSEGFAKFIADRFLGVITYFETCLAGPIFEKPLKEEALYSLGQIIRFVGADHVTQFRFKIIAMLNFVLSLNDPHLQAICLKIWNIFLHIVNIQELGPSLSRIVASLQPLLLQSSLAREVNAIYEFVILRNDSLLGSYISDLYFLEDIESVTPAIRQCVARQTDILKSDKFTLHDKLGFFHKQITNDNLQVRIFGLQHLRRFFAQQRIAINHIVLNEIRVNPILDRVVDTLLEGCRHDDRKLQLASAKCLGELGAIDPSYLPFNFACVQSHELPLSIHTDDFAIMALTKLCRAHQFQKDTKYVDSFSLAIQETLSVCGVSPHEKKKMNVWEAIPLRLRQVMEPLLKSCYTGSRRESRCKEHPIFGSSFCRSFEDWAFLWGSRMIDWIVSEETRHLLHSYKPSIRRDSSIMSVFFPYIVLHALQECSEAEQDQMYEEFTAVFELSKQNFASHTDFEPSRPKEFRSIKYAADCGDLEAKRSSGTQRYSEQSENFASILRHATKLCSEQIDFLQRWKREWQRSNPSTMPITDGAYKRISDFLARFDGLKLAEANYNAGEYARALMFLEHYVETAPKEQLDAQITFLISVYGKLQDIDSAEGAVHVSKSKWKVLGELEVSKILDRQQELSTCYETLFQDSDDFQPEHVEGLIDCYLRMDTPQTALFILNGLWQQASESAHYDDYDEVFKKSKFEVFWRLGSYDEMYEMLEDAEVRRKKENWNTHCAEAFLLYQRCCENKLLDFGAQLEDIRSSVLTAMRNSSSVKHNSYPHFYDEVVKLHLLDEIDNCYQLMGRIEQQLDDEQRLAIMRSFFADWDAKLSVLQPTVRVIEPLLNLRRNLLYRMSDTLQDTPLQELIQRETGKLWLLSAQMNRNAGCLRQAQISIENAEVYAPSTLFIERAKLLWQKGEQTKCFKLLDEQLTAIDVKCQRKVRSLEPEERLIYAEAKLLQASYNAESMNICSEQNLRYFKEAVVANRQSEQANLKLAQYYEKIYASFSQDQKNGENGRKMLIEIMLDYARSLRYGYQNVYQSLPRLLSLWLDYTSQCAAKADASAASTSSSTSLVANASSARLHDMQDMSKEMNNLLENCCNVFPTAMFYTTFSQLLSRICHPSNDVFNVLRSIFIRLIEEFPQQSLWMLLPILKSSYTHRIKRCKQIFTDARLAKPQFQKLLTDFNTLTERLIELTNKDVVMDRSYELSSLVKQLPKLFEDSKFSQILLPFEKFMQASFPISASFSSLHLGPSAANPSQDPLPASSYFPYKQIYICGIREQVCVLRSAAKPKKITIVCSDGKEYAVMVKPKDDLRKDFRLMEFNGLVKRYLHQDPQARHRRLRIRTYAAIPFNEECGLVEWLPNLNSFRSICTEIYRMRNLGMRDYALKQCIVAKTEPIEKKRSVFVDVLLAKHPPVFHEWFRQRFSTPHSWYEARSAFVKTIAVMSMVGYILGLGDRHGENVLFDETNGDAVHVDFNCLFNQGENFAVPELVPFRLTRNMVFAMGPLGVEGMYRKSCEITLRLLKEETNTLMSVLRPFVYDLEALSRNYNKKQSASTELTDPKALNDVRRIEERLQGYVKRTLANSMPLSTEGQVNFLIDEATNIDNLASMYIGWGAYI